MSRDKYQVFSEGNIKGLTLKNRLVCSATYEASMTKDGRVTDRMLEIYRDIAGGGVGLVVTGATSVMQEGKSYPRQSCIHDDMFIDEIGTVADVIHGSGDGCRAFAQLHHAGRQVLNWNKHADCAGPSDVPSPILEKRARVLTSEEIQHIVSCFVDAITRVKKAGYDGVQLHAAHGYLLSSFLSPYTNHRDDRYGGSMSNRVNIIREIVSLAREDVGDYPILIKMNCDDNVEGGIGIGTFPGLAREIESVGIDAIEISGGMWDCLVRPEDELGFSPVPMPEAHTELKSADRQSYFLEYAGNLEVDIPVILTGGHRNIERLEEIMGGGKVDFFGLSRPLICEPDLPQRWLEGRGSKNAKCISCNVCYLTLTSGGVHCMLNRDREQLKEMRSEMLRSWRGYIR